VGIGVSLAAVAAPVSLAAFFGTLVGMARRGNNGGPKPQDPAAVF